MIFEGTYMQHWWHTDDYHENIEDHWMLDSTIFQNIDASLFFYTNERSSKTKVLSKNFRNISEKNYKSLLVLQNNPEDQKFI